jgi:hypothetical protein
VTVRGFVMHSARLGAALCVGVALTACSDAPMNQCSVARLAPLSRTPSYAVVTSDYVSTAIALLDADGALLDEAWLDSGTTAVGLSATLNGDVVLPSAPLRDGTLTLIDRAFTDVVTRVTLSHPAERVQAEVRASSASIGWSPNPHDLAGRVTDRFVLTRFAANELPDAPLLDRGDDVVELDLASRAVVSRVDLSALGVELPPRRPGDPPEHVNARPDGLARAGTRYLVGLARLSLDFQRAGPGAVALVDVDAGTAASVPLDGLSVCGEVRALDAPLAEPAPLPGDVDVVVLCLGATFEREAVCRATAGLAVVRVPSRGAAQLLSVWRASEHAELGSPTNLVALLGGGRALYSARGEGASGTTDRLVVVELGTGEAQTVYVSDLRFALFGGAYDASRALLLVPEAERGVHRFDVGSGFDVRSRDLVAVSPCRGLPARQVGAL